MRLEQVTDIEHLRQAALLLEDENKRLVRELMKLKDRVLKLEGKEPEQLRLQIAELEALLQKRSKALFGDSSEKRTRAAQTESQEKPAQTGHGRRAQPELPIVEEAHDVDEADKQCKACGGELSLWEGQAEVSEEIDVVERQFVLKKHVRKKYRCQCGGCIETAPAPLKLHPGARYSIDFAIDVAVSKYSDHLPLERQVRIMGREGLLIDSQTLWDPLDKLGKLLEPSYQALLSYVLSKPVVGADETHWRLMGAQGGEHKSDPKRWQVWTVCSDDAVYYQIQDSRGADAAEKLLGKYQGTLISDGYAVYPALAKKHPGIKVAFCWAHARRKFVEAESAFPAACREVLDLIGQLYQVEAQCRSGPDSLRQQLRDTESRTIIDRIERWALEQHVLPQSALGKAIAYMGHLWPGLVRFLDDPQIAVDNNHSERALRGVVVGRKNHYGSRSRRGTEVAAILYSLLESAKLADVEPRAYLRRAVVAALCNEPIVLPHHVA